MQLDNYIQANDEIRVVYRSQAVDSFTGTVVLIEDNPPGTRTIVVVPTGTTLLDDGAIGVREDRAVFSVRRGDAWVLVPSQMTLADAQAKSTRNAANERKRIQRKVPLFAEQIEVHAKPAQDWIDADRQSGEEALDREHIAALKATELRDQVKALVSSEDYDRLIAVRERFAQGASYGNYFWSKQLKHIQEHGKPDIFVPKPVLNERLRFPWLTPDAHLTWTEAPGGKKKVRVLFIGSDSVMVRVIGEPITDYDPILIPKPVVWLAPNSFAEANETSSSAALVPEVR
jgi:hypothetical protein